MKIITAFDQIETSVKSHTIIKGIQRFFPDPYYFDEIDEVKTEAFFHALPAFEWSSQGQHLALFFLASSRPHLAKFFYDLISHWLMPDRKIAIQAFFSTDFKLPGIGDDELTYAEMIIDLQEEVDIDEIKHRLDVIHSDIRLGMTSAYHAARVFEVHGRSGGDKGTLIQEKVAHLVQAKSRFIDYDIFEEMQHFFVMSSDEFKAAREAHHLSRLIALFYLFRKSIELTLETEGSRRHIRVKAAPVILELPTQSKHVIGIVVGLNLQNENETFGEEHLKRAIESLGYKTISDSFFSNSGSSLIYMLYIEIEKANPHEVNRELPGQIEKMIEVGLRPLFMPRNEEEILRNIVTLSHQLRFVNDMPQFMISFDPPDQGDTLSFTVTLVRILFPQMKPIETMWTSSLFKFVPDRIKQISFVRKKYPKEATVFRLVFDAGRFLRDDLSIDLYRARQMAVAELETVLGKLRDYSGGLIARQIQTLDAVKYALHPLSKQDEMLLEKMFHSLYPIEMRSVCTAEDLKMLFQLLKQFLYDPSKDLMWETDRAQFRWTLEKAVPPNGETAYVLLKNPLCRGSLFLSHYENQGSDAVSAVVSNGVL